MPKFGVVEWVLLGFIAMWTPYCVLSLLGSIFAVVMSWRSARRAVDQVYLSERLAVFNGDGCDRGNSCALAAEESVASSLLLDVLKSRVDNAVESSWYGGWEACMEWFEKGCPPCPDDL